MSYEPHVVNVGDIQKPFGFKLVRPSGQPVDLASLTVKVFGKTDAGAAWITETDTGVTKHPTTTFTVDTTRDELIANDHKVKHGDQVVLSNSGGGLPTGLAASTRYFAIDVTPNRFRVSLTPNGRLVDITGSGTGTQSFYVVGSGQYDFVAGDVDTAGRFWLWVRTYDGSSEPETFPIVAQDKDRGLPVKIVEAS